MARCLTRTAVPVLILAIAPLQAFAAVADIATADVAPRAFSVAWASGEPVVSAALRVFADAAGTQELTGALAIQVASQSIAGAHTLGLVKVDVAGLDPDTCYYFQTRTTTASGTEDSPLAAPFTEVCTELKAVKIGAANRPIANEIILHDLFEPDGDPAAGTFALVSAPGLSAHPVVGVAGSGGAVATAAADLNNLYGLAGTSLELDPDTPILVREYRGLTCGLASHVRSRYGKTPQREELIDTGVPLTEVERLAPCFFADTLCDDTIDILDAQRVLNTFGLGPSNCAFNPDLDIVADDVINVLDVQSVLNRFGQSAPFP